MNAMTLAEKLLARAAGQAVVQPGQYLRVRADTIMLCDLGWPLIGPPIEALGAMVDGPERVVVAFDHLVPATTARAAEIHAAWRAFGARHGITQIHDIGDQGISHVLSVERGYARPGTLQISVDTHANACGAVGCFAIAIGMDVVCDMVLGWCWLRVPQSIRVQLDGALSPGIMVRDVAQHVIGAIGVEQGLGSAVEFVGSFVEDLSIAERMVLCNWSRKIEALTGLVNPDETTCAYVAARTDMPFDPLISDVDAHYAQEWRFDVGAIEPLVAQPPAPTETAALRTVAGRKISQAFVGSCAGGYIEDLRAAAQVLDGHRVAGGVRLIVSPGSQAIWQQAEAEGLLGIFARAGAIVTAATCGACFGGMGILAPGEVCVSTSTENFPGRMGSVEADIYLASPMTVAASAVTGRLTDARTLTKAMA